MPQEPVHDYCTPAHRYCFRISNEYVIVKDAFCGPGRCPSISGKFNLKNRQEESATEATPM
jgi:hypothetical protein